MRAACGRGYALPPRPVRQAASQLRRRVWPEVGSRAPTPKEAVVKPRLPSPAMVVAVIALDRRPLGHRHRGRRLRPERGRRRRQERRRREGVAARGGRQARGDPDRRQRQGPDPRTLPRRRHARRDHTLSKYLRTVDNQAGRPTPLLIIPGIGRFDAQCDDVDPTVGTQTTRTSVTFTASVNQGVNVSRLVGRDIGAGQRPDVFTPPRASRCRCSPAPTASSSS